MVNVNPNQLNYVLWNLIYIHECRLNYNNTNSAICSIRIQSLIDLTRFSHVLLNRWGENGLKCFNTPSRKWHMEFGARCVPKCTFMVSYVNIFYTFL